MSDAVFKHNDPDCYHDKELTLHDCVAENVVHKDSVLSFHFSDGFWIMPQHEANSFDKTIRTDAAQVDFYMEDINDVSIEVHVRNIFRSTKVEFWNAEDLLHAINNGKLTIEFLYQYRTYFEQMWRCVLCSKKKPYYRECYLHIPGADAIYRWNDLLPHREW